MNEIKRRQRGKPHSFENQLNTYKQRLESQMAAMREGPKRTELQKKITQVDRAIDLNQQLLIKWDQHDPHGKAR